MGNPLVAQEQGPSATEGTGLLGDVASLATDHGAVDFTLDGVSAGLDAISIALDPFGAIASAGVGWLLNHVSFLREPLDDLTGNADAIYAASQTWKNVSASLEQSASQYRSALGTVETWTGAAADDYRAAADDYIKLLQAIGQECTSTATGLEVAGVLVGTERALIYGAISDFVGRCIVEAIAALAASWFTFGGSIAAFVAVVDVDASIQAEKSALAIGRLMKKVAALVKRLDGVSQHADQMAKAIDRAAGKLRWRAGSMKGLKTINKNRFLRSHPGAALAKINRFEKSSVHGGLEHAGETAGKPYVKDPLEAAKQANTAQNDQEATPSP
jgi:hypothetical protein